VKADEARSYQLNYYFFCVLVIWIFVKLLCKGGHVVIRGKETGRRVVWEEERKKEKHSQG
jgi:hypothetical protein